MSHREPLRRTDRLRPTECDGRRRLGDFRCPPRWREFVSACGVAGPSAAVDPTAAFTLTEDPDTEPLAPLTEIDQSILTEYSKRQMILASRDTEKRAWRVGPSGIHVWFQEFSRLRTQLDLYRRRSDGSPSTCISKLTGDRWSRTSPSTATRPTRFATTGLSSSRASTMETGWARAPSWRRSESRASTRASGRASVP
jgi:hypothetical protein